MRTEGLCKRVFSYYVVGSFHYLGIPTPYHGTSYFPPSPASDNKTVQCGAPAAAAAAHHRHRRRARRDACRPAQQQSSSVSSHITAVTAAATALSSTRCSREIPMLDAWTTVHATPTTDDTSLPAGAGRLQHIIRTQGINDTALRSQLQYILVHTNTEPQLSAGTRVSIAPCTSIKWRCHTRAAPCWTRGQRS